MSALRSIARGLGVQAMGDPPPGAGAASLSTSTRSSGSIQLVGSMGRGRVATYLQIYRMNPWVYSAANYIARGIGRLPLHTYQLDAKANKERIRSDLPATPGRPSAGVQLDRILSHPLGPSRAAVFGTTMRERLIFGKSLWEILNDGGLPYGLQRIPWKNVEHVEYDGEGGVKYYDVRGDSTFLAAGRRRIIRGENTIHFGLGSDLDDPCGVSILESCHHTLALHEAIMRHLFSYTENSLRPSGMFKAESAKAAREARQLITELYTSPENAGMALVTNAEWVSMSDSPDHAHLVELVKESRIEIAAAFQVPPPILGLLENAIRANVKELREQFGRDTVGPWATEIEDEIEGQLLIPIPAWNSLFVEFQLAEALRPDLEARALVYHRLMWIMSIDEIRGMENLPPLAIEGVTDVPWVQSGSLPVTTAATRDPSSNPAPGPRGDPDSADRDRGLDDGVLDNAVQIVALTEALDRANGNGHLTAREITT